MHGFVAALSVLVAVGTASAETTSPGDALVLDAPTRVVGGVLPPAPPPTRPTPTQRRPVGPIGGLAIATAVGMAARVGGRRQRDDEPLYVVVHGHGGSTNDFDELLAEMGVSADRVVAFDYSTIDGGTSSTASSRRVSARETAEALDALIRGLADRYANIYSIHHSKGAAAGALMIANIDAGRREPIDGYSGAALLDPPMSRGLLGGLQSAGQIVPWIPDDGGFDPVTCDLRTCHDLREGLGRDAGVEVMVIRNPDAGVTNFATVPADLRVFDLIDDGGTTAWTHWWYPPAFLKRVFEAHGSVLRHEAVARCIEDEVDDLGSCDWTGGRRVHGPMWGSGGGRNLVR